MSRGRTTNTRMWKFPNVGSCDIFMKGVQTRPEKKIQDIRGSSVLS
jgi:hypothetical protein